MRDATALRWGLATTFLVAALFIPAPPVAAHKHTHAAPAETTAALPPPGRSPVAAPGTVPRDSASAARAGPAAPSPYAMPPMGKALSEHLHNKIVHVPLTLAVVAAALLLLARRWPELERSGRWLVWMATAGGAGAFVTGRLQKEGFQGEPREWLVGLHERWGTATAIALLAWTLLTLWKPARRHAWLWGLVAAALAVITGFYGGVVSHGE